MSNRAGRAAALLLALAALAGCGGDGEGAVSGTVTVDSQTPAEGSSITFMPAGGKSSGGGAVIKDGKYAVRLPAGSYKVEIRVPRPLGKAPKKPQGEGPGREGRGGPANIEESLPAKFNDKTELTFDVKPGKNEKNWELSTNK
jgi:hypothetical protein